MGGDSCSKGRGFESRLLMLDGHFFTYLPICCKICNVCLKRRKQIKKRPHWPIFKTIWGFESMRSKYVESCDFNFVELFEPRPCETSNLIRFLDLYHRLEMCFSNFLTRQSLNHNQTNWNCCNWFSKHSRSLVCWNFSVKTPCTYSLVSV